MKRFLTMLLAVLLTVMFFVGCAPKEENNPLTQEEGLNLDGLAGVQRVSAVYENASSIAVTLETGGKIEFECTGPGKYSAIIYDADEDVLSLYETDDLDEISNM